MSLPAIHDHDIVIVSGARTPIGRYLGGLSQVSATRLGEIAAIEAIRRSELDPSLIDAVFMGSVIQSSPDAVYLARHVGLRAGAPISASALTLNRLCGSGLEALLSAARLLRSGEAQVCLAGGAENMSLCPHVLRGARSGLRLGPAQPMEDMLWSALFDAEAGCLIGETLEHVATTCGVTREDADQAALWSQQRAAAAQARGRFEREIVSAEGCGLDEHLRPDTTAVGLSRLRPAFRPSGVVTAGNATGLNDAAAALVVTTGAFARAHGVKVLGRLVASATVGVEPRSMGLGPVPATTLALERANLPLDAMDLIEINDAFAVQYVATERALGMNRERVNVNGGCLALGHPMGATGARLILTALLELQERDLTHALVTLAVGGGQGMAAVLERC